MNKLLVGLVLVSTLAGPVSASTIIYLNAPGGATDNAFWNPIGPDSTPFANGRVVNTAGGNFVAINLGTQPSLGGETSVVCDTLRPLTCSWAFEPMGYAGGDTLLWLQGNGGTTSAAGTGPLTFTLGNAVGGLGLYVQPWGLGSFTARLDLYNGSSQLIGTHTFSSDLMGDPLYLGALDNSIEIKKAVITILTCGGGRSGVCDVNDFSVDTLQLYDAIGTAPEPSTFVLGGSMIALGFVLRKRLLASAPAVSRSQDAAV